MGRDSTPTKYMTVEGQKMAFSVYGRGPRVVVLTHGILLNKEMFVPLAKELAKRGNRVVALDMVGHGQSGTDSRKVSIPFYGRAVVAAMDELGIKEAVIGGTSLGANIALEVAATEPSRVRGMVVEMPVLERAMMGGAMFFGPLLVGAHVAEPLARIGMRFMRLIPSGVVPFPAEILLDVMRRDPGSTAGVIEGVFFGRLAPSSDERRKIDVPALVIGHHYDPIHPYEDARQLSAELPNGSLVVARSVVELRVTPKRLTNEIAGFLDLCWKPRAVKTKAEGMQRRKRPKRDSA